MAGLLELDLSLFLVINHLPHTAVLDTLARVFSGAGTVGLVWFVIGTWLVLREEKKDHWFFAPLVLAGAASWLLVEQVLKPMIARLRPGVEMGAILVGGSANGSYSFPSGHATIAWALAPMLAAKEQRWRWLFYVLALLISVSRIFMGKHFPLDVVAGGLLGWGIGRISLIVTTYVRTILR